MANHRNEFEAKPDYSYYEQALLDFELNEYELRAGLPLTDRHSGILKSVNDTNNGYGILENEIRYNHYHDPKTGRFCSGNSLDKFAESGIIRAGSEKMLKVNTDGRRNETALTEKQIEEVTQYAVSLGMPKDRIYYVDYDCTGYGCSFDLLRIGTDVYPSEQHKKNANSNISMHGAIAHEIIGHRMAALSGKTHPNEIKEEAQASIRAAKFTPKLSDSERITLYRDAINRLKNNGIKLKDVKNELYIFKE